MSEPTKVLFDGHNMPYRLWAGTIRNKLAGKECLEAITSKLYTVNADGEVDFSTTNAVKNGKAADIILSSLSVTLATRYADSTAYDMWMGLKNTFNVRTTNVLITELCDLLNSAMSPGDDPIKYWVESASKWNMFPNKDLDLKTVSVLVRLAGLSKEYSAVRDKYVNTNPKDLKEEDIFAAIKDMHTMRQVSGQSAGTYKMAATLPLMCQLCDTPGHAAKQCPSVVPRPSDNGNKGSSRQVLMGGLSHLVAHSKVVPSPMSGNPTAWMLDSGAMANTTPYREAFKSYSPSSGEIMGMSGETTKIHGVGCVDVGGTEGFG
ncbi:hypothetical protein GGI19_000393, partial [Coemansia pectinata]